MNASLILAELRSRGVRLWVAEGRLRYEAPSRAALPDDLLREIKEHRAELIALIRTLRPLPERAPVRPAPPGALLPVSYAQERFLFLDRLEGASSTFNLSSAFLLRGRLRMGALIRAMAGLIQRHHVLRSAFDMESEPPTQRVVAARPAISLVDMTQLPPDRRRMHMEDLIRLQARQPFDIRKGPHLRTLLIRLAPEEHVMAVFMHHIVSDGASIEIYVNELKTLYARECGLPADPLPALAVQFADYAFMQRSTWSDDQQDRQIRYWRDQLAGAPALIQLPLDHPRPAIQSFAGSSVTVPLTADVEGAVSRAARRHGVTEFQLLLTAFAVMLLKYGQQNDVVIGTPVANRSDPDIQRLIGPFINMVPIRVTGGGHTSLSDLLVAVKETVLAALDNAKISFERIVAESRPKRSASHSPLFQVLFVSEETPVGIMELPGLSIETLTVEDGSAKYDLTLALQRRPAGLVAVFKYNPELFEQATMKRMASCYLHILRTLLQEPATKLSGIRLATPADLEWLDAVGKGPERDYPLERCLHSLFEEQANRTPDIVALDFLDRTMTYRRLNEQANRLAHRLIALEIGPEDFVGIIAERSFEMIVAALGVLKAGAAYVPIDPEYPPERQHYLITDAGMRALLVQSRFASAVPDAVPCVLLDGSDAELSVVPCSNPPERATPDNACCIFYTSGSTGLPKGVVLSHRAMCNNLHWMQDCWPLSRDDVMLLKASFSFDVSLKEIFWPLLAGGRLVIAKPGGQREPPYLHEIIVSKGITVVHLVPTMLDYFLQHEGRCESLRIVMCGGEALSINLKERFCARFRATLLHLYGPTEAAIAVTGGTFFAGDGADRITLGRPMANAAIRILDPDLNPVPIGVPGELCIGGTALARGYHGRPSLTADKFRPTPFPDTGDVRLYRTGDLARWRPDGQIEYLGRMDRQVKFRGFRIELGEIEVALKAQAGVHDVLVTPKPDREGTPLLCAYVVPRPHMPVAIEALRQACRARLPSFMVPDRFIALAGIPLNPNGKADIEALPPPDSAERPHALPAQAATPLQVSIHQAWKEVLGREDVGAEDNFFEAGGHSLLIVKLQRRLKELTSLDVAATSFFAYPTIASLAAFLGGARAESAAAEADRRVEPIAVIGMAGRFPGADDVAAYWENIRAGRESIRFFTEAELLDAGVPQEHLRDPSYVRARGVLDKSDQFDASFFRYSMRDADLLDPQLRLLLELAQHAFDDAGYDPSGLRSSGKRVGVFVSVSRSSYFLNVLQRLPHLTATFGPQQISVATDKSFTATQLAYRLDLRGPALTIDTACSSSLVAIHQACQSILAGDADFAIAGGASVDAPMDAGYFFQEGNVASPDGHCRPFDADAAGTLKGSGGGLVLLKPLSKAIEDGDQIHAIIRGSAINNDGSEKVSYTAPSETGQAAVVDAAVKAAGVPQDSIGYIETHGTGTPLGDPIELAALSRVFRGGEVYLGAVKANIGHLDAAAGIAGFIKAALVVREGWIPPLTNFTRPNPSLGLGSGPFRLPFTAIRWSCEGPRRAGVSSFGIGGTNVHVVMEQPSARPAVGESVRNEVILVSAATPAGIAQSAGRLAALLAQENAPSLSEVAFTLAVGRRHHARRLALVAPSRAALIDALAEASKENRSTAAAPASARPAVIFLVSGHGAQHPRMGRSLFRSHAAFRDSVEAAVEAFRAAGVEGLESAFMEEGGEAEAAVKLQDHVFAQAVIFTLCFALARTLETHGIRPSAMLGLSIGEATAACLAGVLDLPDAARLIVARSCAVARCGGHMLSIAAPEADILSMLPPECDLAVVNGPGHCVVSGPTTALGNVETYWSGRDVRCRRLHVEHAAHSRALAPHLGEFAEIVSHLDLRPPAVPIISNVTGRELTDSEATAPGYWARQLRDTVQLGKGLETILSDPSAVLVEIGPGTVLTTLAQQQPGFSRQTAISLIPGPHDGEDETSHYLTGLGRLWEAGLPVEWDFAADTTRYRRVSLPGYPFQRRRHWLDDAQFAPADGESTSLAERLHVPTWLRVTSAGAPTAGARHWLVAGQSDALVRDLLLELERQGAVPQAVPAHLLTNPHGMRRFIGEWRAAAPGPAGCLLVEPVGAHWPDETFSENIGALNALDDPIRLVLLTRSGQRITGAERVDEKALAASGLARGLLARKHGLLVIDLPDDGTWPISGIAAEALGSATGLSGWRNGFRWQQNKLAVEPQALDQHLRLPPGKTFLITPGTGDLGLTAGEALAASGLSHLVLSCDMSFPDRSRWPSLCAAEPEGSPLRRIIERLIGIEAAGTDIILLPVEAESFPLVAGEIGPVDGVVVDMIAAGEKWRRATASLPELVTQLRRQADSLRGLMEAVGPAIDIGLVLCEGGGDAPSSPYDEGIRKLCAAMMDVPDERKPWRVVVTDSLFGGRLQEGIYDRAGMAFMLGAFYRSNHPEILAPAAAIRRHAARLRLLPGLDREEMRESASDTMRAVRQLWIGLLGVEPDEEANFFVQGGDSLRAAHLLSRIRSRLGARVRLADFFAQPTAQGLVSLIDNADELGAPTVQAAAAQTLERESYEI